MLKKGITLFIVFVVCQCAWAQQPSQYSLYMFNRMAYNPAYAGLDNSLSTTGVFRRQWVNLEGSPTAQHLNLHAPLYFLSSGLGFSLENDELGLERNLAMRVAYNYQLNLNNGILSIGIGGGILQKTLNGSGIRTPEGDYIDGSTINHRDNFLPIGQVAALAPTFEFGIYYKSEQLEIGISTRDIVAQPIEFTDFTIRPIRSFFFTASSSFELNRSLVLRPSVFVKTDILQTQMDFSALFTYNDNITLGTSFRGYSRTTIDALAIIGGLKLNDKTNVFYSYDVSLSQIKLANSGSHEIMLNYNLNKSIGKGRPPKIIYNPRFL